MKYKTATEIMVMEEARHTAKMNYKMAKALVEGKVDSLTLSWAEMVVKSKEELFKETKKETPPREETK